MSPIVLTGGTKWRQTPIVLTGGTKWRQVVKCISRSHNHLAGLPVPLNGGPVPLYSLYCCLGTENNPLPLQRTKTQFC